ncbi:MAG: ferrous iron transporter B [Bacteroidia bacterium]|nr:ferrous iron transporter B [Bacteroidia bacterium]
MSLTHDSFPQRIILTGIPNTGKTTLFNYLTGLNQKTANFAGVTVEVAKGVEKKNIFKRTLEIIDLPGLYGLYSNSEDEKVVLKFLTEDYRPNKDIVWLVGEATRPFKNFFLLTQLLDMGIRPAIVYNMKDELPDTVSKEDLPKEFLGLPVCWIQAGGAQPDVSPLSGILSISNAQPNLHFRDVKIFPSAKDYRDFLIKLAFQSASDHDIKLKQSDATQRSKQVKYLSEKFPLKITPSSFASKFNAWLLHPVMGSFMFLLALLLLFVLVFYLSEYPMNCIEEKMKALSAIIAYLEGFPLLVEVLNDGIIPGITGVLVFVPQIFLMYTVIIFMESSGMLTRFSFLFDKPLRKIGLSGQSMMALMGASACAIPSILSLRSLKNHSVKKRLIWLIPLISCSARIPVYLICVYLLISVMPEWTAFRPLIFMAIYASGPTLLILVSILFRHLSYFRSASVEISVIEMPPLRMPTIKHVANQSLVKAMEFVRQAGMIIFFVSLILWYLGAFGPERKFLSGDSKKDFKFSDSWLYKAGSAVHPFFKPLGFDEKTSVAILASLSAREVFVGTLAVMYEGNEYSLREKLLNATDQDGKKIFQPANILSLLVFYIFALQCISTLSITYVESGRKWKPLILQFMAYTSFAWLMAFLTYQCLSSFIKV